jgi:uncharacterized SAM-binding protein YcdF (DUF218 family)
MAFSLLFAASCSLKELVIKKNKKGFAKAPYDAIIVPGYPFEAPSHQELFNIRIHWAKTLYERGVAKNIIFSGGAIHTPYLEGKIMKLYAQSLGIEPTHIFEENEAVHSHQNLLKGKKLAKKLGFKKVAVATDPFQFAYMTLLVGIYTPGMPLLTFTPDSMPYFYKPLPEIDGRAAFIENWSDKTKN